MHIRVLMFAHAAEAAGQPEARLELPVGATVADALAALVAGHPALAGVVDGLAFAVNQRFVRRDFGLSDGDELALIPPVSGG